MIIAFSCRNLPVWNIHQSTPGSSLVPLIKMDSWILNWSYNFPLVCRILNKAERHQSLGLYRPKNNEECLHRFEIDLDCCLCHHRSNCGGSIFGSFSKESGKNWHHFQTGSTWCIVIGFEKRVTQTVHVLSVVWIYLHEPGCRSLVGLQEADDRVDAGREVERTGWGGAWNTDINDQPHGLTFHQPKRVGYCSGWESK